MRVRTVVGATFPVTFSFDETEARHSSSSQIIVKFFLENVHDALPIAMSVIPSDSLVPPCDLRSAFMTVEGKGTTHNIMRGMFSTQ